MRPSEQSMESMLFFRKLSEAQVNKMQECNFCGSTYKFISGEKYRPGGICKRCWQAISEIERMHSS